MSLEAGETALLVTGEPLLPVRMLNEFAYCPRLAYLEWVQSEFADSADTVEGRFHHRRVDESPKRKPPEEASPPNDDTVIHQRSVWLSSDRLGITAKIDLVEGVGHAVAPVDYKRGKRPHVDKGAWEPERVQVCAQGLILRENGYECDGGVLYFVGSRERVVVAFDSELIERTLELIAGMRRMAQGGVMPSPLVDSPKCPRCSLVRICLPDEIGWLRHHTDDEQSAARIRRLLPARHDALPLYVQQPGARVGKQGDCLRVMDRDVVLMEARLVEVSHLVLFGAVQVSTQVVQELCRREIPISYLSSGGWFYGITTSLMHKNVELRRRQYAAATSRSFCLGLAIRLVQAKIVNCRTFLRRNHAAAPETVLLDLKRDHVHAAQAQSLEELLGIEGTAARRYFAEFKGMLKTEGISDFEFDGRNRRPPKDPVNALLSLAYAMLAREWTVTLHAVGLDPYLGFYHQLHYGRPALALDVMEEFRPLLADSAVLTAINNGEVRSEDFIRRMGSVALTPEGRRRFIETYERRMSQEITHPVFGYQVSYRRVLEVQARLLSRYLCSEIPEYPAFTTR
ncbi:CRISPR-associated protein Cas4/endonuclease Cas1 fusion [Candidatus Nitrospira nitrosa]|uniref:CRISPR-associated endonuclease Cas1 n=1 Tax=Candidatus Nitrospira nitrosa TaxID=1742972 RepID=A0A0S4LLI3_9BACT|nr:CRISPR-associated endonuclease Cas1 [Candidatus Nitrospira nitrosa]CUS38396.1 CRISPR-associated protein Cas4/endonuclease Cas1 fusion [Candidatus Nitrospira nitrosa]